MSFLNKHKNPSELILFVRLWIHTFYEALSLFWKYNTLICREDNVITVKKNKSRMMWVEAGGTFACFDLPRFDFFLLMMVLNQSPDPMAASSSTRSSAQETKFACSSDSCFENSLAWITWKGKESKLYRIYLGRDKKVTASPRWCNMGSNGYSLILL